MGNNNMWVKKGNDFKYVRDEEVVAKEPETVVEESKTEEMVVEPVAPVVKAEKKQKKKSKKLPA
jgi:topoisomerase IA-like protein